MVMGWVVGGGGFKFEVVGFEVVAEVMEAVGVGGPGLSEVIVGRRGRAAPMIQIGEAAMMLKGGAIISVNGGELVAEIAEGVFFIVVLEFGFPVFFGAGEMNALVA